jgi:hypothetical protein
MLVDIYARSMLNATRHSDLPVRPLPAPARRSRLSLSGMLRFLKIRVGARQANKRRNLPHATHPVACK